MIERSLCAFLLTSNNFQQMDRRPGGQPFHASFWSSCARSKTWTMWTRDEKRRETGDRLLTHTHTPADSQRAREGASRIFHSECRTSRPYRCCRLCWRPENLDSLLLKALWLSPCMLFAADSLVSSELQVVPAACVLGWNCKDVLRWIFLGSVVIPQEAPFCVSRQISRIREEKSNGAFEGPAWQGVGIFHPDSRLDLVQSLFFLPHWKKKSATQFVSLHSYTRTDIQFQLKCDTRRVHSAASGTACIPVRLLVLFCFKPFCPMKFFDIF